MTNPTLERAARAAYERYGFTGAWDGDAEHPSLRSAQHDTKELFRAVARAVLMAVREPDDVMKAAWLNAEMHGTESAWFLHRHKAMIDAILADGGE